MHSRYSISTFFVFLVVSSYVVVQVTSLPRAIVWRMSTSPHEGLHHRRSLPHPNDIPLPKVTYPHGSSKISSIISARDFGSPVGGILKEFEKQMSNAGILRFGRSVRAASDPTERFEGGHPLHLVLELMKFVSHRRRQIKHQPKKTSRHSRRETRIPEASFYLMTMSRNKDRNNLGYQHEERSHRFGDFPQQF